jgi:hypothetical protein
MFISSDRPAFALLAVVFAFEPTLPIVRRPATCSADSDADTVESTALRPPSATIRSRARRESGGQSNISTVGTKISTWLQPAFNAPLKVRARSVENDGGTVIKDQPFYSCTDIRRHQTTCPAVGQRTKAASVRTDFSIQGVISKKRVFGG